MVQLLCNSARRLKIVDLGEYKERNERFYYRSRLVILDNDELKIKILCAAHDALSGGHSGCGKTLELIQREYYWPRMFDTIRRYVGCCYTCRRAKASREKYHGLLKPLPVPERRWQDISVDFVVDLPESEGYTNVIVVVDRLSKFRYMIPCKRIEAANVANMFLRYM